MIVRSHEIEQRIMEPRLLQVEKNRVDAIQRSEPALGKSAQRFAGRFKGVWVAELQLLFTAAFEDAEDVAWLADGESGQGVNERQDAMQPRHFRRVWNRAFQPERRAVETIGLAELVILCRVSAIVVERGAPEHRSMS